MTVYYEKVTIDCGHEYIELCEVLLETSQGWLVVLSNGEEEFIRKVEVSQRVRQISKKVGVKNLVHELLKQTDTCMGWEFYGLEADEDQWLSTFVDKMVQSGALKEGEYEIPNQGS